MYWTWYHKVYVRAGGSGSGRKITLCSRQMGRQTEYQKTLKRINHLLVYIQRNVLSEGSSKPEPLPHVKEWSRRIDETNRLVYTVAED